MKVKGIVFSGFAAAILMGTAHAATPFRVASQAYVDARVASATTAAGNVSDVVGDVATGLNSGANTNFGENTDTVLEALNDLDNAINTKADSADVGDVSGITGYASGDTIVSTINGMKTDISGKQDKLSGGTGYEGKVVTAGASNGAVTYTTIDSSIGASGTSNLITSNAVKTYVDNAISGVTGNGGQGIAAQIDAALGSDFSGQDAYTDVTDALADKQDKSDSTVAAADVTAANHLTAGAGVAGNLVALGNALGTVEGTVGNSSAGLVHDVAALQQTIGDGTTSGVAKDVSDLNEQINGNGTTTTGLAGDVAALDAAVNGDPTDNNDTGLVGFMDLINGYSSCITIAEGLREQGDNTPAHCVLSASTAGGLEWTPVTFPWVEE